MSRLPAISRDKLSTENQAIWDRVMSGRSTGGPFGALIHVPRLAERIAAVEAYFRSEGALPATDRELVILATGRDMEQATIRTIERRGEAWEAVGYTTCVTRESVADLFALLREDGQLNGPADVDAFLDPSFLRDGEKETRH